MATLLTINTTPDAMNAAYRPIVWNATSADANIRAVRADVYINGTYTTTLDGVQQLGSTSIFDFDVRKIMQGHLISELRTNITTLQITDATASACSVKVRLFEIVETAGVYTHTWAADGAGTNYLESSTYFVSNTATQHQEVLTSWTVDSAAKLLLTNRSDNNRIVRGVPFQIGFLTADTNLEVEVIEMDANLNTINTHTSATKASITYGKGVMEIPTSAFSDANAAFLDIKLQKNAVGDRSITYRYKIDDVCEGFTLFWQNSLGGFDHFDFGSEQKENISTKNTTIRKPLTSGFSSEDAGLTPVSSKVSTKISLSTKGLSAAELVFLQGLIKNHTVVYKWDSAGTFLSYVISSHSKKVADNVKLINKISLTLKPANEHIAQNGN